MPLNLQRKVGLGFALALLVLLAIGAAAYRGVLQIQRATTAERHSSAVLQGQAFTGCWRVMGNAAHLLYEDGDEGLIPLSDLKPELRA